MSECTIPSTILKNLDDHIQNYADWAKDETLDNIENENIRKELENLRSLKTALDNEDYEFVSAYGRFFNKKIEKNKILTDVFEKTIGNTFNYSTSEKGSNKKGIFVDIYYDDGAFWLTGIIDGKERKMSFERYSDNGKSRDKKNSIFLRGFRTLRDRFEVRELELERKIKSLGSDDGSFTLADMYLDEQYVHGNQEDMLNILEKLHVLGGEKAKDNELTYLKNVIKQLDPSFFNELKLFVKEEVDTKSQGIYTAGENKRIDLKISNYVPENGNHQSEASVYVEEVLHSMTASAIASDTKEAKILKRQLDNIIDIVRNQITWENFTSENYKNLTEEQKKLEEKEAKKLLDYILNGDKHTYEFIAKGVADQRVKKVFEKIRLKEKNKNKSLFDYIIDFFDAIVDIVQGNLTLKQKNQNVTEALLDLSLRFGKINNENAIKLKNKNNYLDQVFDVVQNMNETTSKKFDDIRNTMFIQKIINKKPEKPKNIYEKVKFYGEVIALSLVNKNYRDVVGAIANVYGLNAKTTVREIISGLFETDQVQQAAEILGMKSGYIDKIRNRELNIITASVLSGFKNPDNVTEELEIALTDVLLDTDLYSLIGNSSKTGKLVYDNRTVRDLLTSTERLEKHISQVKNRLRKADPQHYNWHKNQATGLGYYMATHRAKMSQNLNATNIAKGIHSSHLKEPKKEVVELIDELSTLVALRNTSDAQKNKVAELMKIESRGVQHVADVALGFKANSEEKVFQNGTTNKIKGYSREIFDSSIIIEIAPVADKEKMKEQGFEFKTILNAKGGETRTNQMALYTTSSYGRPERLRGGVRLNQIRSKGRLVSEIGYIDGKGYSNEVIRERNKRDIERIKAMARKEAKEMEKEGYEFKETTFGLVPVLNEEGRVVDYRYMMDKENKKNFNQNRKISNVLGKSYSNLIDKNLSYEHNQEVLKEIKKDVQNNWRSGILGKDTTTEYTLISPISEDPSIRKIYFMMPESFREYAKEVDPLKPKLPIRTDLLFLYFGYDHMSIANSALIKKFTPQTIQTAIKFAEAMWIDSIKIVKTNILLKIPTVGISNILSNLVYATMRGYNPVEVLKLYKESYRDITDYNNFGEELQILENRSTQIKLINRKSNLSKRRKKELVVEQYRVNNKIKILKERIKKSPIDELVKLGLDQNVEDLTNEADTNKITNFFDNVLEPLPQSVRIGIDYTFLTKRTVFYKVANEFLEKSDLIARDVQNRLEKKIEMKQVNGEKPLPNWWLRQQKEGYKSTKKLTAVEKIKFLEEAEKIRNYDLVQDFINYTKPSSRLEEYLNRIGIFMFTKYVKLIQRITFKNSTNHPITALIGLFVFGWLLGIPTIHDQSFLSKDWYGDSTGPGNVFPIYGPIKQFFNFITPALLKDSTYDFLPA